MGRRHAPDQLLAEAVELHRSGQLGAAVRLYEKAVRKAPENASARNLLGLAYFQSGRLEEAAAAISKALSQQPNLPDGHYNLGTVLQALGRNEDAVNHYKRALGAKPDDAGALNNLGTVLKALGRREEAIDAYRRLLALRPDFPDAHINLGNVLRASERHEEAIAAYKKALSLQPFSADAHLALGMALMERDRMEDAAFHFEQVIALKPNDAAGYFHLGNALREADRNATAAEFYERALALDPDHLEAQCNLAWALDSLGRLDEALEQFERALTMTPAKVKDYVLHAGVLSHLERFDECLACADKAIEIDSANADAYVVKGGALLTVGRLDEAADCFEKAIEIAPKNVEAHNAFAGMRRFSEDDPRLTALEALARETEALTERNQMLLHVALGKAYTDRRAPERAIPHMIEAGRLKRSRMGDAEEERLARFDRIRAVFTEELIRSRQGHGDPSSLPVFIVGMPRSGTTLAEQILASHPRVFAGGEREEFNYLTEKLCEGAGDYPEAIATMPAERLHDLGSSYLRRIRALAPTAERITDKMPGNFVHVGLIHLSLPNAKIIHTRRDPLDNCMSCFSTMFAKGHAYSYDLGELGRHYRAYGQLMEHWRTVLPPGAMLEVQYEDVVEDLETYARRIVAHCGLEWDDACLAFHKTKRPVRTASVAQVRQPIYRSSVGRWRGYEHLLRPLIEALELAGVPFDRAAESDR